MEATNHGGYFNALEKIREVELSSGGPTYRYVNSGLNIQGKCVNSNCKAYNDTIYAIKEFGVFNMLRESSRTFCPSCKEKTKDVTNCGFLRCKFTVEGERNDVKEEINITRVAGEKFLTFDQGDIKWWHWLDVKVEKI